MLFLVSNKRSYIMSRLIALTLTIAISLTSINSSAQSDAATSTESSAVPLDAPPPEAGAEGLPVDDTAELSHSSAHEPEPTQPGSQSEAPAISAEPSDSPDEPPHAATAPSQQVNPDVKLGGGVILYYYQPTKTGRGNVGVFFANLLLDAQWDNFGLHLEPRFRDTKLRPFFEGPAWLQEAYASASFAPISIKVGKVYKRSGGLFWDNSFFGNVQVYDGLKLDPNYGVSVEGSVGKELGLDFAAQYFVVDGSTNVSLQSRDTISIQGARRRHTKALKAEPWIHLGTDTELRLGGSFEHFVADIPDAHDRVWRAGGDVKLTSDLGDAGSFGVWGEYLHQAGRHVIDHPAEASGSDDTDYFLAGAQYSFWILTARYNLSHANYRGAGIKETLQVPGLGVNIHEHLTLLGELAHWRQFTSQGRIPYNDSVNITLHGRY
jgi:hypothetical protein